MSQQQPISSLLLFQFAGHSLHAIHANTRGLKPKRNWIQRIRIIIPLEVDALHAS